MPWIPFADGSSDSTHSLLSYGTPTLQRKDGLYVAHTCFHNTRQPDPTKSHRASTLACLDPVQQVSRTRGGTMYFCPGAGAILPYADVSSCSDAMPSPPEFQSVGDAVWTMFDKNDDESLRTLLAHRDGNLYEPTYSDGSHAVTSCTEGHTSSIVCDRALETSGHDILRLTCRGRGALLPPGERPCNADVERPALW